MLYKEIPIIIIFMIEEIGGNKNVSITFHYYMVEEINDISGKIQDIRTCLWWLGKFNGISLMISESFWYFVCNFSFVLS